MRNPFERTTPQPSHHRTCPIVCFSGSPSAAIHNLMRWSWIAKVFHISISTIVLNSKTDPGIHPLASGLIGWFGEMDTNDTNVMETNDGLELHDPPQFFTP